MDNTKKKHNLAHKSLDFDKILSSLDAITSGNDFFKERIEIFENVECRGAIGKGDSQYFEFNIKGCPSPIRIVIHALKGSIKSYLSLTNTNPSKENHYKIFENEFLDLYCNGNIFTENCCYIGIYALSNSKITIKYSSNIKKNELFMTKSFSQKKIKKSKFHEDINKLREDSDLRLAFEKKIENIYRKRRTNEKFNFIRLNKSTASIFVPSQEVSFQIKTKLNSKLAEVKKKKVIIYEEKIKSLKEKINRHEIRKQAEKKANDIQKILLRKQKYEKKWIKLIFFFKIFVDVRNCFVSLRKNKINQQIRRMLAYTIQKNYKLRFPAKFSFRYRILALAKNHFFLYQSMAEALAKNISTNKIVNCVQEISNYQKITTSVNTFISYTIKIQKAWKKYSDLNNRRLSNLFAKWNKVMKLILSQKNFRKGVKNKKNLMTEKLNSIPEYLKEKIIREYLHRCKSSFVDQIRNGKTPLKLDYDISEEELKKIILSLIEQKHKNQKKTKSDGC